MKAEFLSLSDGVRITIEIIKTRSKLYNRYTFSASGREPFSGKVPKDWNCEKVLHYWWKGDCREIRAKANYIGSICLSGGSVSAGLYFCPDCLNLESLHDIEKKEAGYIIAAPVCYLPQEWLDKHRIIFLKVGRDIQASRFRPSARWKCTMEAMEAAANKRIMERAKLTA